jgi:hypothetical protein
VQSTKPSLTKRAIESPRPSEVSSRALLIAKRRARYEEEIHFLENEYADTRHSSIPKKIAVIREKLQQLSTET